MELGSITQLVELPEGCLACAHKNGRISIWNEKWELTMQVAVPTYEITVMGLSLGRYLWAGYRTGMMYIYDISGERWSLIKVWEAHDAPIAMLAVDEQGLLSTSKPVVQIASADHQGNVTIWDGLLSEYRKDQRMKELEETYCDYRPTRIQISSWNIDALDPESIMGQDKTLLDEWMTSMRDADIIVIGLQEIVDLESKRQTARTLFLPRKKQDKSESTGMDAELVAATAAIPQYSAWRNHITAVLQDKYTLVKTEHLVGLFSLVFIKHTQQARITDCESTVVKTGLKVMNKCWHGNKGAVAIRFRLDDATLCFVNCHLAAGQSRTEQRNADADGIFKSAKFKDDVIILDHEHCFVSGDLNYRLDTWTRQDVLDWLKEDKTMAYRELQEHDQLLQQRQRYPLSKLAMLREAPIRFDPTYKYDPGSDNYDSSDKQRIPAWCDRVLFHTDAATPEYYKRHEVKASDHRPISAGFEVPIKTIRITDYDKVLKVINQAWEDELKSIIQGCKIQYIADYGRWEKEECIRRLEDKQWDVDEVIGQHNGAKRKI
ncbi:Endonuclease/exonuclease/phosphatase [Fennellomyces sp. T-0311]|nr:Endonuclease/exonuclease/phosphatase [Fennellomyces sp. T-0311]